MKENRMDSGALFICTASRKKPEWENVCRYHSPVGVLELAEDGRGICRIGFPQEAEEEKRDDGYFTDDRSGLTSGESGNRLLDLAVRELEEYFGGRRKQFDLPLSLYGTEFQVKVWKALLEIPYGETRSYGQTAAAVGNPKACRAIGMANHANPIMIVVPCHRVIGADGSLTGYGGGLDVKRRLLQLEGL